MQGKKLRLACKNASLSNGLKSIIKQHFSYVIASSIIFQIFQNFQYHRKYSINVAYEFHENKNALSAVMKYVGICSFIMNFRNRWE